MRLKFTILFFICSICSFAQKGLMMKNGNILIWVRDVGDTVVVLATDSSSVKVPIGGNTGMTSTSAYPTMNGVQNITNKTFGSGNTWNGNAIADQYISSATTWNAKQNGITTGTTSQYFRGDLSLSTFPTTTAAFTNSTDKNFVTDAQLTIIGNTSGTNTGNQTISITGDVTASGSTGALSATVTKINGTTLSGLATGILKNTTSTGVPSIAVAGDFPTLNQNTTGSAATLTTSRALWGNNFNGSAAVSGAFTVYNGVNLVGNGIPSQVATIDLTAQTASINNTTMYTTPASAGFYRLSFYITVTQAATTSSTMPSVSFTYIDGNAGTNTHTTQATSSSTGNSVTTTFAQATQVFYAKASTAITYSTASYATSGATGMQYALRIRLEAL